MGFSLSRGLELNLSDSTDESCLFIIDERVYFSYILEALEVSVTIRFGVDTPLISYWMKGALEVGNCLEFFRLYKLLIALSERCSLLVDVCC